MDQPVALWTEDKYDKICYFMAPSTLNYNSIFC